MTNREKLLNTNIYDLLALMNKTIILESHYETCVLECIEQKPIECTYDLCEDCIQKYLNEEVQSNEDN